MSRQSVKERRIKRIKGELLLLQKGGKTPDPSRFDYWMNDLLDHPSAKALGLVRWALSTFVVGSDVCLLRAATFLRIMKFKKFERYRLTLPNLPRSFSVGDLGRLAKREPNHFIPFPREAFLPRSSDPFRQIAHVA